MAEKGGHWTKTAGGGMSFRAAGEGVGVGGATDEILGRSAKQRAADVKTLSAKPASEVKRMLDIALSQQRQVYDAMQTEQGGRRANMERSLFGIMARVKDYQQALYGR